MEEVEYYTREKGYTFYILEADGKTVREAVDVNEWRNWGHATSSGWGDDNVNGWDVVTWFFGEGYHEHLSLWVTSVYPKGHQTGRADYHEEKWNTYEEAEVGHKEVIRKIKEGIILKGITGDSLHNERQKIRKRSGDGEGHK